MLYIIRHGQTAKNKQKVLQGRSDLPLNEEGRRQSLDAGAALAARGVTAARVYSSPLIRAVETAKLACGTDEVTTDERLIEMAFFMDFAGTPAPEGMEQLSSVVERTGRFADEIIEEAGKGDVVISTHAIAMKGILEYLTPGSDGSYWSKYIGNCEIYAVPVTEEGYGIPYPVYSGAGTPGE